MSETIIVGILVFAGTVVTAGVSFFVAMFNKNVRLATIEHNLDEVNKKLEEHNGYAKKFGEVELRMGKMEVKMEKMGTDIEWIKNAISQLNR